MTSRLPPSSSASIRFGNSRSTPPSKDSNHAQGQNEGSALTWLEYAECSLCRDPLLDGVSKGKHYWMTSCGHILCSADKHEHKMGECTACGKKMEHFLIQEGYLPPEHEIWFQNGLSLLSNTSDEMKSAMKKSILAYRVIGFQYREMKKSINHHKNALREKDERIATIQEEQESLLADNHELHERLAVLQTEINTLKQQKRQQYQQMQTTPQSDLQQTSQAQPSHRSSHQNQPEYRYSSTRGSGDIYVAQAQAMLEGNLPTVAEEEDSAVFKGGPTNDTSFGMRENRGGKRMKLDGLQQQPRRFIPPTPISGSSDIPLPAHHFSNPARPQSRAYHPLRVELNAEPEKGRGSQISLGFSHLRGEENEEIRADVRSRLETYRYDRNHTSPKRPSSSIGHYNPARPCPEPTIRPGTSMAGGTLSRSRSTFVEKLKMDNPILQRPASVKPPFAARPTPLQHIAMAPNAVLGYSSSSQSPYKSLRPREEPPHQVQGHKIALSGQLKRRGSVNRF